jgi:hypothetical protein
MATRAHIFSLVAAVAAVATFAGGARAQERAYAPDTPEVGSVEKIRAATTEAKYLPAAVAYVPASERVPSPSAVLGHIVGAPGELSDTATVIRYFRALAAASDRVRVSTLATSEEGREIILVAISDAATLKELDRYRAYTHALADPRTTDRAAMERIVTKAKPFYYLNGGLHSTETGSPEMLMELAYRLAVSERPEIHEIRERVIVLINPVSEPDGRDRVVQWFCRFLKGKTDWDSVAERGLLSPPYWGHYIFHDNNRDGIQITSKVSEAVERMYWEYIPTVVHDLHESVPLLYIMTGYGPYSEAIDPVTVAEWTQFAMHEVAQLQAVGLPGVWTWGFWDGWWPGYLFSFANNHNGIGRFYETFGNGSAETFRRTMKNARFAGGDATSRQWFRTWPPDKVLTWSLRDNVNYQEAGVLEALSNAARHGDELLRNFWLKGRRALDKGAGEPPYAWAFRENQRDKGRLAALINLLRRHRIEVQRAQAAFKVKEGEFPAGSFLVRMDQPYRNHALNLLKVQEFPKDEPNAPYDDVAWTLPLLDGVEGERIDDRAVLDVRVAPVQESVACPGTVSGAGPVFLVRDTGQEALFAARYRLADLAIEVAESAFKVGDAEYPPGSWMISAAAGVRDRLAPVARELGLEFVSAAAMPDVAHHALAVPRLAVYHTWTSTQDVGWARYTLDRAGVPYAYINDGDLRAGELARRFDVILVPNAGGDARSLVHGIDPKFGPLPYTKTPEFPSHGIPDGAADITGGMGFAGMSALQRFLADGGVLVTLANAGRLAAEGGLVRSVDIARTEKLYAPGSELRAKFRRPEHPIAYGYPETIGIFRAGGPVFTVADKDEGLIVLQFGTKKPEVYGEEAPTGSKGAGRDKGGSEPLCLSGLVRGEEELVTKPAILDVPAGRGHVVIFGFNPLHRFLNHADFRLVYNAILNFDHLPAPPPRAATTPSGAKTSP